MRKISYARYVGYVSYVLDLCDEHEGTAANMRNSVNMHLAESALNH